jgi:hypothetical protein
MANATSTVAVFPGYLGGAFGFRSELAGFDRRRLLRLVVITLVGGLVGSSLLLVSSNEAFSMVVPFLLLGATIAFLFGEKVRQWAAAKAQDVSSEGAVGLFGVALYGGYFNGGLGIVLLALFSLWGMTDLNRMNALKSGLSFLLSAISVAVFAVAGLVAWPEATHHDACSHGRRLRRCPAGPRASETRRPRGDCNGGFRNERGVLLASGQRGLRAHGGSAARPRSRSRPSLCHGAAGRSSGPAPPAVRRRWR